MNQHEATVSAARAREASEADYRGLIHDAALGLCRLGADGALLDANAVLAGLLGYRAAAELLAVDAEGALYADADERASVARRAGDGANFAGLELRWRRADGRVAIVRLTGRNLRGPDGALRALEAVVEDVSAQRALEQRLQSQQRLESIGRLAGGIAHDFNNLLTVILANATYFESAAEVDPAEAREAFREIGEAARRGAGLVRQLLAFGRRQAAEAVVLELNPVIADLGRMLRRLVGEDIEIVEALAPDAGFVRADRAQLEQVILNLALNARDAMPRGGRLEIRTRAVEVGAEADVVPGRYALLEIADSGHGMDAETLAHLFEPFFTTKARGKGTGLGLATVYGIVRQNGGRIGVRSAPGRGTTFEVLLPSAAETGEAREPPAPPPAGAPRAATVLLVEDDDGVRAAARRVLEREGYVVIDARDAAAARAAARARPVDLLVTDVVLGDGHGAELARALAAERPGLRTLFATGHLDRALGKRGRLDPGAPLLRKPFTQQALLAKVRELLDAPG